MTASQKLELRRSEIRQRLGEILAEETLTDELKAEERELAQELKDSEIRLRCAIQAEAGEEEREERETETEDAEEKERRELRGKARVGRFLAACIEGRAVSGAEAEVRAAYGGTHEHEIPLAMFEPEPGEKRAATPAPSSGTEVEPAPTVPFVYKDTVAAFLGIEMPSREGGTAAYPVLTTQTPSGPQAAGDPAAATAAAFTVSTDKPRRITGQFEVRYEDLAVFGELEDALRRDIPLSVADALDTQALNGDGTSPNLNGLLTRLTDPTAGTDVATFASVVSAVAGALDGRYASSLGEVRLLTGKATNALFHTLYRGNNADRSLADYLMDRLAGYRMSDKIAAPASDDQAAVLKLGTRPMDIVMPLWGAGIRLLRDDISKAGTGTVTVTALQLAGSVHVLRSGSAAELSFHLA